MTVVEPRSAPRKRSPSAFSMGERSTRSRRWRSVKASRSAGFLNNGGSPEPRFSDAAARISRTKSSIECQTRERCAREAGSMPSKAAPMATAQCASQKEAKVVPVDERRRSKAARSSERKVSGPPRKAILPLTGRPQARPLTVCSATASSTDRATSDFGTPPFKSATKSVLANTPQRDAIGCEIWASLASLLSPAASTSKSDAI